MEKYLFKNPANEYREIPFWSWNDHLEPEELIRQIGLMDKGGWGGFFMHSRVGLQTPYMGPDWLKIVQLCVNEAGVRGMQAWLYDEDRWPSGYAGGLSVAANPAFRSKRLVCKVDDRPALLPERIATFTAHEVEGMLQDICFDSSPSLADSNDRLIQFYPQTMPLGEKTFNDYTYIDLLNPQAVCAFLDSTHAAYARILNKDFGKTIPGIFTDEPCFQFHTYTFGEFGYQTNDLAVPWTDDLPSCFQSQHGYDLVPNLPALFFDVGEHRAVRYDFWQTVTRLFVERYTRQVYEWCERHGLAFTGHFMGEDTLLWQIPWVGSAMPHLAWMHIPGVDKLGRNVNGLDAGMVLTIKQLDSIVCQLGKSRALCENYGCSGQDLAFTGRKWIGDWAYTLGINLNNPHLALYSMRGERKRDCPPNLFFQQPWWSENKLVADYFTRLSYILSQGQRKVDILVIHPVGSAWTLYRPGISAPVMRLDRALNDLLLLLMQSQRDFHLGDEMLMRPGELCQAFVKVDEDSPRLSVGQMTYRLVVIPPGVTLSMNTVCLLREFTAVGGSVLALEPLPSYVEGRVPNGNVLPAETHIVTLENITTILDNLLPFDVHIPAHPEIWVHHRQVDECHVYFLANTDITHGCLATVRLNGIGRMETWDPSSGEILLLPTRAKDGITEINLDFPPAGSHLLVLSPVETPIALEPPREGIQSYINLSKYWQLSLDEPNSLILDTVQVNIDEMGWSQPLNILDAHKMVARAGCGTHFALRFSFEVANQPQCPVFLVLESPESFRILVNGQSISTDDQGWWIDPSFRRVDISRVVMTGRNEIILRGFSTRATELESIYIIGNFGVIAHRIQQESHLAGQVFDRYMGDFTITPLPELSTEIDQSESLLLDLTAQGLPFFAGRVKLSQQIKLPEIDGKVWLEIVELHAALAKVWVNGHSMKTLTWPPYKVDLTAGIQPGNNTIEIELVSTLRNLLGPHHLAGGDPNRTNPEEFNNKERWTDNYILVPFGWGGIKLSYSIG
jgi:hypothetical protein